MSDYTPTTAEHRRLIEDAYGSGAATAFDRWLAAHDREVAAKAWGEGFDAAYYEARMWGHVDCWEGWPDNPYRKDTE